MYEIYGRKIQKVYNVFLGHFTEMTEMGGDVLPSVCLSPLPYHCANYLENSQDLIRLLPAQPLSS